jgi:hypothetical protein
VKRVEIIKVEVEIVKSKLLAFLAISGGSWVYVFKIDDSTFTTMLFISFIVSSYGVFANMLKLSDLHRELKGLK